MDGWIDADIVIVIYVHMYSRIPCIHVRFTHAHITGDMALEIIREEEDDNLAQDPAKPGMNVESNGNELDAQLSDDYGTGNEQDGLGAFTPDNTIDADLPDP